MVSELKLMVVGAAAARFIPVARDASMYAASSVGTH